jgi:hypothetical protein
VRLLAIMLLIAWSLPVAGDVPRGSVRRLVRFVVEGCDYFSANPPDRKPEPSDRKLAAHFGRVSNPRRDGNATRYDVKVRALDGWDVSYWWRGIDIKIPETVAITVGDLQKSLGPDTSPDVDYAMSNTSTQSARVEVEEREFNGAREDGCHVTVTAEADKRNGTERRVFSLRFAN